MEKDKKAGRERSEERDGLLLSEQILRHLIFAALGALLGSAELFFGVRPFGVALAAVADTYFPAAAGGTALYAIITKDYLSLAAIGALLLVRVGVCVVTSKALDIKRLFRERPLYRVTAAAAVLLGVGVFSVIRGGFRFYDLFGVLLAVSAAPLAAVLYLGIFEERDKPFPHSFEAGLAALVLTGVFAMRSLNFFGIYPAAVVAVGIAFLLVSHRGGLVGVVGGTLAGLCFDWRMAPAFLLCAAAFALLQKSSRGGGVIAGSAAAGAYAFLLYRTSGITELLPSLLVAGALFLAFDSAGLVEGAPMRHLMLTRRRAALQSARAEKEVHSAAQLQEMSGAFLDLSGTFYEISSRMRRPAVADLRRLCDKAFDSVCPGCRNREICWGKAYRETVGTVEDMARRLFEHGMVTRAHVKGDLPARCAELSRILGVINNGAAALTEEALHGDKTSVVAMDYAAMGRVISETLAQNEASFVCDTAAGERIFSRLLRLGYSLESVAVCGKSSRRVLLRGVRLQGRSLRLREIRRAVEKHCHFTLGEARVEQHEGLSDIVFEEYRKLKTESVKLTRPKGQKEGKHCGDSVAAFSGERGLDYAFICDGMGSGNAAALTSALASVFLTRLLQAGGRADSALRMLNGFLAARSRREGENSTTVDLLEIDRVSGAAALFKCGAATTYLLRRGAVTRFFSRTAPVGILEALDAERISFTVEPGDVLVQISDGFTGGEEDCPWLAELLEERWVGDAEEFARMALNRATKENNDDISLIVTVVSKAPLPGTAEDERESA